VERKKGSFYSRISITKNIEGKSRGTKEPSLKGGGGMHSLEERTVCSFSRREVKTGGPRKKSRRSWEGGDLRRDFV